MSLLLLFKPSGVAASSAASLTFHPATSLSGIKSAAVITFLTEHPTLTTVAKKGTQTTTALTAHPSIATATRKGGLVSSFSWRAAILADSPVLYQRLGESTGTNADDQSVSSLDGTYEGAHTKGVAGAISGDGDTAVLFSGGDVVFSGQSTPGAPLYIATGTIEAWIKTTDTDASFHSIFAKQSAYALFVKDGNLITYDYTANQERSSGISVSDGSYHHVVMTFDSGVTNGSRFYVDGVQAGPDFTMTVLNQGDATPHIGTDPSGHTFNGTIDEVAIYSYALTSAQVTAHYQRSSVTGAALSIRPAITTTVRKGGLSSDVTLVMHPALSASGIATIVIGSAASLTFHPTFTSAIRKDAKQATTLTTHPAFTHTARKGGIGSPTVTIHPAFTTATRKGGQNAVALVEHPSYTVTGVKGGSSTVTISFHPAFTAAGGQPAQSQPKLIFHPSLSAGGTKSVQGTAVSIVHPTFSSINQKGAFSDYIVADYFEDVNGTLLQNHKTQGGPWVKVTGWAGDLTIDSSGRLYDNNAGSTFARYALTGATPPTPDYDVEATIDVLSISAGWVDIAGRAGTTLSGYSLVVQPSASPNLQLVQNGTSVVLQTADFQTPWNAGETHRLRISMRGSRITAYVDGVQVLWANDTTQSAIGTPMIRVRSGSSTTGIHVVDFKTLVQTSNPVVVHPAIATIVRKTALTSTQLTSHVALSALANKGARGTPSVTFHPSFFVIGGPPAQSKPQIVVHPMLSVIGSKAAQGVTSITAHHAFTITPQKVGLSLVTLTVRPNTTSVGKKIALSAPTLSLHPAFVSSARRATSVKAQVIVHPGFLLTYVVGGLARPIRPINTRGYLGGARTGNLIGSQTGDMPAVRSGSYVEPDTGMIEEPDTGSII